MLFAGVSNTHWGALRVGGGSKEVYLCVCVCAHMVERTSRLHHLVELGLNVQLRVFGLDTLQLDGHLLRVHNIGPCTCAISTTMSSQEHDYTHPLRVNVF